LCSSEIFVDDVQNKCGYTVGDYNSENYPLASFSGICDKNGALYNLYGFCW